MSVMRQLAMAVQRSPAVLLAISLPARFGVSSDTSGSDAGSGRGGW